MRKKSEAEELIEIFSEEASDLLNALAATVQQWSSHLDNNTYLVDLKRDLHTLKGGARMVNQTELSTTAHELESLCEALLTGNVPRDRDTFRLVFDGIDRMARKVEALSKQNLPTPIPADEVKPPETHEVIRVRSDLLEKLNNLSIENNIIRVNLGHHVEKINTNLTEILHLLKALQEKTRNIPRTVNLKVTSEILGLKNICKNLAQVYANIESALSQQSRVDLELQEKLVDTRMVPFNSVVPRLGRITRQLAAELNKKVDFTVSQMEGEIDRNLLEHLIPSLEHLLRNAIDHGIELSEQRLKANKPEVGKINLRFFRMGNDACVEISDDGGGIDVNAVRIQAEKLGLLSREGVVSDEEAMRYILEPGFSTRKNVSEVSGRGIGMDVVNTVVKGLGGHLSIESKPGLGTKFTVRLPFTTSINRALLVVVKENIYGILLSNVENIILLSVTKTKEILGDPYSMLQYNDKHYQLKYLGSSLGIQDEPAFSETKEALPVLLFNFSDFDAALLVDGLLGSQEVVVQNLGPQFKLIDIFSGATLLADGRVVVVLDAYSLTARTAKKMMEITTETLDAHQKKPIIMVVDDSVTIRTVTKNFLERHQYAVITAKDGIDALEKLEKKIPDIILLDVEMPRMDGFKFVEAMRSQSRFSKIPVIMITFLAGGDQQAQASNLGVARFMSKPYQEPELLDAIASLLEVRK